MASLQTLRRLISGRNIVILLLGLQLADSAVAQPRIVRQFQVGQNLQGPIRRISVDQEGSAWIATPNELYRAKGERAVRSDSDRTASKDREIALAPGGGWYARLSNGAGPNGLFGVELFRLSEGNSKATKLESTNGPAGFSGISFGNRGNPIVTTTPMDNAEGLSGEFQYWFWSESGRTLGAIRHDGPATPILDELGGALLLLGAEDASAYAEDGTQLWKVDGRFRKAALARHGKNALLNPAKEIDEVRVIVPNKVVTAKLPGAVHEMALTPDGQKAAVATSGGVLSLLDVASCLSGPCSPKALPSLLPKEDFNISAVRFLADNLLVVAVIKREGKPPDVTYKKGDIFVVNADGETIFHEAMDIPQPPTRGPLLDVAFHSSQFAAYTRDRAIIVSLR